PSAGEAGAQRDVRAPARAAVVGLEQHHVAAVDLVDLVPLIVLGLGCRAQEIGPGLLLPRLPVARRRQTDPRQRLRRRPVRVERVPDARLAEDGPLRDPLLVLATR